MAWISREDVERWLSYQPVDADQIERIRAVRHKAKELAHLVLDLTPRCADQSAAIRLIREVVMTANAAIVCEKRERPGGGEGPCAAGG